MSYLSPSCVIFDEKIYFPGDTVTGLVLLVIPENIESRQLSLTWKGQMCTNWFFSPDSACKKELYKDYCYLWMSEDGSNIMPAGSYTFSFSFKLPFDIPPTFRSEYGFVKHGIKVIWNRVILPETVKIELKVSKHVPIDTSGRFTFTGEVTLKKFFFEMGVIEMDVSMKSKTLTPGDVHIVKIAVKNDSDVDINHCAVYLRQYSHYHSRPQPNVCEIASSQTCPLNQNRQQNKIEKKYQWSNCRLSFPQGKKKEFSFKLEILDGTFPSFKSSLITVYYQLEIVLGPVGLFHSPIVYTFDVEIGHPGGEKKLEIAGIPAQNGQGPSAPPAYPTISDAPPAYEP